jgi:methionyl-tRNA synthetase
VATADTPDATPTDEQSSAEVPATVSFAEFKKIQLKVATIQEACPHPNADKLLILRLQLGDRQKQVVAGIRKYRDPESLVGRQVIVVDNLEPVMLRGERSEGMLLAVLDVEDFALVVPDAKVSDGRSVS